MSGDEFLDDAEVTETRGPDLQAVGHSPTLGNQVEPKSPLRVLGLKVYLAAEMLAQNPENAPSGDQQSGSISLRA